MTLRGLALIVVLATLSGQPARAVCASLVASMCDETSEPAPQPERKVLKVDIREPDFAVGDRFPVEEHSLLMNPVQYGLPSVDGPWRYYAFNYAVYRVDAQTAEVLEVIRDSGVIRRLP